MNNFNLTLLEAHQANIRALVTDLNNLGEHQSLSFKPYDGTTLGK